MYKRQSLYSSHIVRYLFDAFVLREICTYLPIEPDNIHQRQHGHFGVAAALAPRPAPALGAQTATFGARPAIPPRLGTLEPPATDPFRSRPKGAFGLPAFDINTPARPNHEGSFGHTAPLPTGKFHFGQGAVQPLGASKEQAAGGFHFGQGLVQPLGAAKEQAAGGFHFGQGPVQPLGAAKEQAAGGFHFGQGPVQPLGAAREQAAGGFHFGQGPVQRLRAGPAKIRKKNSPGPSKKRTS